MHCMITMDARPRQTDGRTNITAIARGFVLRTHRALKTDEQSRKNGPISSGENLRKKHTYVGPNYCVAND